MQQLVSITSQGQISIPARMRRELGLNKYALKEKSIREVQKLAKEAIKEGFAHLD